MKKMFLLFGMLAMVGILFVACSDQQDLTSPEEAAFKKVSANCSVELQIQLDAIDDEIDEVLMRRPARNGAHQILDNIARKVCANPPDYESTQNMVMDFEALLDNQPPDQIEGGQAAADRLLAAVSAFASGITVPPEALELTGAVGVVEPGTDDVVITENREAAIVVDPASFDGDEPVTIILTRLSDADTPIPGFTNFAERYEVFVSRSPSETGDGVLVAVCVPDDQELPAELALGHKFDGKVEVLVPVPVGELLDCDDAQTGFPLIASTSGLFGLAQLMQPVVDRFLGVKPLHAIYFAGTGLGGRTKSFSPVAPIDPTIKVGETVQLTIGTDDVDWSSGNQAVATVDDFGLVTGVSAGTAIITALVGGIGYTIAITVEAFAAPTLFTCQGGATAADFIYRGFHIPQYWGDDLIAVDLYTSAIVEGNYQLSLTAQLGGYDGTVIAADQSTVHLSGGVNSFALTRFVFPTPAAVATGSTIAFKIEQLGGPDANVYYQVSDCPLGTGCETSCPVVETEGTNPPLDIFRRQGIGTTVYGTQIIIN